MTDFDINASDRLIREAVYGGPALPPGHAGERLRREGVRLPAWVVAARGHHAPPAGRAAAWACRVHPGLTYLTFNGSLDSVKRRLKRLSTRTGDIKKAAASDEWLRALQQAIVSLRRQELKAISEQDGERYTFADENQTQMIAVEKVRRGDPDWPEAIRVWIEIVLLRHQQRLDDVRRKVIELLTRLTRSIDRARGLGFPFGLGMRRVYETFAFSDMPQVVDSVVQDLMPHLIGQSADIPGCSPLTRDAMRFLRRHKLEPVSLADVAAAAHVSAPHLARRFKRETGRTVTDMLHVLRVGHAKQLLIETDHTVLTVALASGFDSPEHFHRIFKRVTGLTPRRYRLAYG